MKHVINSRAYLRQAGAAVLALLLFATTGCKNQPAARTDQQMTSDIQAKISGEGALNGQNIQVSVVNGVATLNGTVSDEASRALAANDSGTVNGVRTVVNNLTVQPGQPAAGSAAPPQPTPAPSQPPARDRDSGKRRRSDRNEGRPQEAEAVQPAAAPEPVAEAAAPAPQPPPPPPPPPKPMVKEVTLPEGTVIPIRITETLDTKTAQANDVFHGSLAGDLGIQGVIAVPHGSAVMGRIVDAREAAHFKGAALLSIELTQLTARGRQLTLVTDTFTKEGAGRGKNTAEKAGGGAALGSIIGALAGGGKGAAIGAIAGAGAGTGVNAATRGQQVVIPTETLINFRLQSPVTLTVTIPPSGDQDNGGAPDPQLQRR
jgi:BON domain